MLSVISGRSFGSNKSLENANLFGLILIFFFLAKISPQLSHSYLLALFHYVNKFLKLPYRGNFRLLHSFVHVVLPGL